MKFYVVQDCENCEGGTWLDMLPRWPTKKNAINHAQGLDQRFGPTWQHRVIERTEKVVYQEGLKE
jgi:hypothetical protein